jgi:uncharacterized membrane protein YhaH (DUF805 family)
MDYVWYLFSFKGRINRARCWLAGLIIICWMIFLGLVLLGVAHLFGAALPHKLNFSPGLILNLLDPQAWRSLSSANLTGLLIQTVLTPLALWVYLATSVKRLHDRNKSGWWIILFFLLPGLYSQFGARLEDWLGDSWLAMLPDTGAFVFSVWAFVEMYCLKGTTGTNRFGADPLAPIDTRPPWDQQSEIEMVPHKAGPPPV